MLVQLLHAHWPQADAGLFDRTRISWFALHDMAQLLQCAGLKVERVILRIFNPEAGEPLL